MIPVHCRVRHDPEAGTYGDCVRACIASILELDAEAVPHFYHDNCDPVTGHNRMVDWLASVGYVPFSIGYEGCYALDEILEFNSDMNATAHYILAGSTGEGNHVVVCQGGRVAHNPAWYGCALVGPTDVGQWQITVIARV